jgi:hypothetical protein
MNLPRTSSVNSSDNSDPDLLIEPSNVVFNFRTALMSIEHETMGKDW